MRKKIVRGLGLLIFFLSVIGHQQVQAQPFNLTEGIEPLELNFKEYKKEGEEKAKGRISTNVFTQEKDTAYYFIKGLSMYSPTYFSLNSSDPSADIKVNLCKENWHVVHQTGNVKGKDIWKTQFKTEGDFGIMVVAHKKPSRYVLLVWTGDEMKVDMPSVFKSADDAGKGGGWFKKNKILVIVGLVALMIIGYLVIKLKQKKQ